MPDVKELYETITRQAPVKPDALEALRGRRDRKRRNQRITAGVVGIALFAAAVWLVVTGGPIDRTRTPASGGIETGATRLPASRHGRPRRLPARERRAEQPEPG
jgi:hypothetical protein